MEHTPSSPATNNAIRGAEQRGNLAKQRFSRKGEKGLEADMAIWEAMKKMKPRRRTKRRRTNPHDRNETSRRPSGLRKTNKAVKSLAHRTGRLGIPVRKSGEGSRMS